MITVVSVHVSNCNNSLTSVKLQPNKEEAYAQTQTQTQGTNYTQLFSTDKEFQVCFEYSGDCFPAINVLYHDPSLLVLKSDYVDVIWSGVARAQKEGYKVDAMTSYAAGPRAPRWRYAS